MWETPGGIAITVQPFSKPQLLARSSIQNSSDSSLSVLAGLGILAAAHRGFSSCGSWALEYENDVGDRERVMKNIWRNAALEKTRGRGQGA